MGKETEYIRCSSLHSSLTLHLAPMVDFRSLQEDPCSYRRAGARLRRDLTGRIQAKTSLELMTRALKVSISYSGLCRAGL
jgi:hypothetical protein